MIHWDWLLKRVRVSRDGKRRIPDPPDPLVKRRDEKANVVFICLFFFVWFRQGEGNRALWVVLKLLCPWNWEKVPFLTIVVNAEKKNKLEKKFLYVKKYIFLYLSFSMIHGSAKISSDISRMSLVGKATSSLFVQIRVTQHWKTRKSCDSWPFTTLPRYACGTGTQYPLNSVSFQDAQGNKELHTIEVGQHLPLLQAQPA